MKLNKATKKPFLTYDTLMQRINLLLSKLASIHWWSSSGEEGRKNFKLKTLLTEKGTRDKNIEAFWQKKKKKEKA